MAQRQTRVTLTIRLADPYDDPREWDWATLLDLGPLDEVVVASKRQDRTMFRAVALVEHMAGYSLYGELPDEADDDDWSTESFSDDATYMYESWVEQARRIVKGEI